MSKITGAACIDTLDSAGDLRGKARTYEAVKAAVLEAGRFSVFEATATQWDARLFESLVRDPEVETFDLGYPWQGVRRRDGVPAPERSTEPLAPVRLKPPPGARDYTKPKPVHMAKMIDSRGRVSPACAKTPQAIDLTRATWTKRREAVTCKRCLATIARP